MTLLKRGLDGSVVRGPMSIPKSLLNVEPSKVEFFDIGENSTYKAKVVVRNMGKNSTRLKVTNPQSNDFAVDTSNLHNCLVMPGLEHPVEITFKPSTSMDIKDKLTLSSGDQNLDIPLCAYRARPLIECNEELNFGYLVFNGKTSTQTCKIQNFSKFPCSFTIEYDQNMPLSIGLDSGTLGPAGSETDTIYVKVDFRVIKLGRFNGSFKICVDNIEKIVNVSANIIEHKLEFTMGNMVENLEAIDFDCLRYGKSRTKTATLFNNGPTPVSFVIIHSEDFMPTVSHAVDEEEEERDLKMEAVQPNPREGVIHPFEKKSIDFRFAPIKHEARLGWKATVEEEKMEVQEYKVPMFVKVLETGKKLEVELTGKAIEYKVDVSNSAFEFPSCPTKSHCDQTFTIRNNDKILPITFELPTLAHFVFTPCKGKVPQNSEFEVLVTFKPNQLGYFNKSFQLDIDRGNLKIPMTLRGQSHDVGDPDRSKGGFFKGPEDFVRIANFDPPTISKNRKTPDSNRTDVSFNGSDDHGITLDADFDPRYKYNPTERLRHVQHQLTYGNLLQKQRKERLRKKKSKRDKKEALEKLDLTLGLTETSGLKSPEPTVESYPTDLFLDQMQRDAYRSNTPLPRKRGKIEKIPKSRIQITPGDEREQEECSLVLSPLQLHKITTESRTIDFGKICVYSEKKRTMVITNGLNQCIWVNMASETPEIKEISPKSQVIPPRSVAEYTLTFKSTIQQKFNNTVTYTINGRHIYHMIVNAEVIPVDLKVSERELHFHFAPENSESSMVRVVKLGNPNNCIANYSWEALTPSNVFSIRPLSGSISPFGEIDCIVTFEPSYKAINDSVFILKVDGGQEKSLRCSGDVGPAKCILLEKSVDLGETSVGTMSRDTIQIKNVAHNEAFFEVDDITVDGLVVKPMVGRIRGGQTFGLILEHTAKTAQPFEGSVCINICNGKPLEVSVVGRSHLPNVVMVEEEFNFHEVFVGSVVSRPLTLFNKGTLNTKVVLDLSPFPDFCLQFSEAELGPSVHIVQISDNEHSNDNGEATESKGHIYEIYIDPGATCKTQLQLRPSHTSVYDFKLDIYINGMADSSSLYGLVLGTGIPPPLKISHKIINFGRNIIQANSSRFVEVRTITFENNSDKTLAWALDINYPLIKKGVFKIKPSSGVLKVDQKVFLTVNFYPQEEMQYSMDIPVFLGDSSVKYFTKANIFQAFKLSGYGATPLLSFNRPEITLPIVPLNVESSTVLTVINHGFEKELITYKLPSDTNKVPLSIAFLDSDVISEDNRLVRVHISMVCSKPTSFTTKLDFYTEKGGRFSIPVSGVSDNSLFTVYPFVCLNSNSYEIQGNSKKPISYVVKSDDDSQAVRSSDLISSFSQGSIDSFKGVDASSMPKDVFYATLGEGLVRWASHYVFKRPPTVTFPSCFRENASFLFDCLSTLTGKKVPGYVNINKELDRQEKMKTSFAQYSTVLTWLKGYGAHLSHVRPEYLLQEEDFHMYLKVQKQIGGDEFKLIMDYQKEYYESLATSFSEISYESWLSVSAQIFKLFVINRITPKFYKSLPNAEAELSPLNPLLIGQSNIYSQSEGILLHWINAFFTQSRFCKGNRPPITNFGTDLRDSCAFAALVDAYVPYLVKEQFDNVLLMCNREEEYEANAFVVLRCLREIGFYCPITEKDIITSNSCDMILFCSYLFENLPQYVPQNTIPFEGSLHEKIYRFAQLYNPNASKQLQYRVMLYGCNDFKISQDYVEIPPKNSYSFPIEFEGRFCRQETAYIIFAPKTNSSVLEGQPMVFKLEANGFSLSPKKTFQCISPCYEQITAELEISNPFSKEGYFSITVNETRTETLKPAVKKKAPHGKGAKGKQALTASQEVLETEACLPYTFTLNFDKRKLKPWEKFILPVQFLPFEVGKFTCTFHFYDEEVGEFMYAIEGEATYPAPSDNFEWLTEIGSTSSKELFIPHRNVNKEKALQLLLSDKGKERSLRDKEQHRRLREMYEGMMASSLNFRIMYSSKYFTGPAEIKVDPTGNTGKDKKHKALSSIVVNAITSGVGKYPCKVVLNSAYDTRVFDLECTIVGAALKTDMEWKCAARETLKQKIPIANESGEEWLFQATLTGSDTFKGPSSLSVKPNSTENYEVTFSPILQAEVNAVLLLKNGSTGTQLTFNLKGIGMEPNMSKQISIVCSARKYSKRIFFVPNPFDHRLTFDVESDLLDCMGDSTLVVPARREGEYSLTFNPKSSQAPYTGSIHFHAREIRSYSLWYAVDVEITKAGAEKVVPVNCEVRKHKLVELAIKNPTEGELEFKVAIDGNNLKGDDTITVPSHESRVYTAQFSPLVAGNSSASITFFNSLVGEFWYKLELNALKQPVIELQPLACELGHTAQQRIPLKNPLDDTVMLSIVCEQKEISFIGECFVDSFVKLEPLESVEILAEFFPSRLDQSEVLISFQSAKIGEIDYKFDTSVTLPVSEVHVDITAVYGNTGSSLISFQNPFHEQVSVDLGIMDSESTSESIKIMTKKKGFKLAPRSKCEIPISFTPRGMVLHNSKITITAQQPETNENVTWVYNVKGIPEYAVANQGIKLECKSRSRLEQEFALVLPQSSHISHFTEDCFTAHMRFADADRGALGNSLAVQVIGKGTEDINTTLIVKFVFVPFRTRNCSASLLVGHKDGALWKFKVGVFALEPEVDDTILIEADFCKVSNVGFRLKAPGSTQQAFRAYFIPTSDKELGITPRKGMLECEESENGTLFVVSYCPKTYGKSHSGKLIVQTDEMMWTFIVKGRSPTYTPPTTTPRLNTKQGISQKRSTKNFVRENSRRKFSLL
eukprot:Nk52_evm2s2578 gene=Nk52_evmTU2s2578